MASNYSNPPPTLCSEVIENVHMLRSCRIDDDQLDLCSKLMALPIETA
jgi:hypothetical protein